MASHSAIELNAYPLVKPLGVEVIVGQGNFSLKTARDLARAIEKASPKATFGLAMNEASDKIVRLEGNDPALKKLASETALAIGAGHAFFIFLKGAFPAQVLPALKNIPTVCRIFGASSNEPFIVITAETNQSRAIVGVADGPIVETIEDEPTRSARYEKLKKFGIV